MPSKRLRFTAWLAVGLVVALSVFSASPMLHAWMHAHEDVSANHASGTHGHDHAPLAQEDEGCVVATFSSGVITVVLMVFAAAAKWRLVGSMAQMQENICPNTPRYWLPPLCGPPLS